MTRLALLSNAPRDGDDPLKPLVLRVREGDASAFRELYAQTRTQVHTVLFRLVGPTPELEDLIQDSYVQLLRALRTFRGEAQTRTFIHRVCANVALMHLRHSRRHPETATAPEALPDQEAPREGDPERAAQVKQAASLLERALERMTPEKRVVFVYHELLGLKPEEMAQALELPVNTVRSRLGRAREELTSIVAGLTRPRTRGGADGDAP